MPLYKPFELNEAVHDAQQSLSIFFLHSKYSEEAIDFTMSNVLPRVTTHLSRKKASIVSEKYTTFIANVPK